MLILEKYSLGIGDRFGHQGKAQLAALSKAASQGVAVTPVWNKSFREHSIIGTQPTDTRNAADAAVAAAGWSGSYHLDADHINLRVVDGFLTACDFYTLDMADNIGEIPSDEALSAYVTALRKYVGTLRIPGIDDEIVITEALLEEIGRNYLCAAQEAGRIHRHIAAVKGEGTFITEVSFDEATVPQSPVELFGILAALAFERIPVQTIAPKFSGRFNKGVDYVGDVAQFTREFSDDMAMINFAVREFGLPRNLKLSVHSGSDKFSLYGPIHQLLKKFDAGVHLKTAGTTWLEEVAGLALAGGDGLAIVKEFYRAALGRYDELAKPYATVIDIDPAKLPTADEVDGWDGKTFADALQHEQSCPLYNQHLRQLMHVSFKLAAEAGDRYLQALVDNADIIAQQVTNNLYTRHIRPLFLGQ